MIERTWEYGTTKKAEVIDSIIGGGFMLVDEDGEGHMLMGVDNDVNPIEGNDVTIRFCKGGPTGGYWKMTAIN